MKKYNIISILFILAALFSNCTKTEFDQIPKEQLLGTKIDSSYSISRMETEFMKTAGLFSADTIKSDKDIIINGIITSSDIEGNVYKYIVVQEETPGGSAIKISIDASGISALYPLGQRVSVRCNGLYIGKYAEGPQLGTYYMNPEKNRLEPGRIPLPIAEARIKPYGLPQPSVIKADTMTIAQIKAAGKTIVNKLVCIKNAYFTGKGADYGAPATIADADKIFAPSTNGIGYPQSREIQDGSGASVFVSTSEYSKFAKRKLPASSFRGNITAIVGWYNDKDVTPSNTKIYHQLTLRSITDLGKGFELYHLGM